MKMRSVRSPGFLCLFMLAGMLLAAPASASGGGSGNGSCTSATGSAAYSCDNCISDLIFQNVNSGSQIISAMFYTINSVLAKVEQSFFKGIVNASSFQHVIYVGALLYIAMYGIIIMFNLGSYNLSEITKRLVKVMFVVMMTSPTAWYNFNIWISRPIIGTMNNLIQQFTVTAEGGSAMTMVGSGAGDYLSAGSGSGAYGLNGAVFSGMFGSSMSVVLSIQLAVAIMSVAKTGFFGWMIAFFLLWAVFEFVSMLVEALVTYAKAIMGLAFLFALAPIFFIFLVFDRTRQIFMTWLAEVLTFALHPIILFAFLSFYIGLIAQCVPYLLTDPNKVKTDFCWTKWFSMPGSLWDMFIWRPTYKNGILTLDWSDSSGNTLPSPINIPNCLYFLMLCHLGKSFARFIGTLASGIMGGMGQFNPTTVGEMKNAAMDGISKLTKKGAGVGK